MPDKISIRIDGEYVAAQEGQTILEVARASGKYIPTLCWLENISPVGACRLCIVEVSGVNRLLPACTTPVQDGMSVTTNSEKLQALPPHRPRVPVLRAQPPVRRVRLQQPLRAAEPWRSGWASPACAIRTRIPKLPVDVSHERYVLDHNRCILCTRCVRVCAEVEGAHVWDVSSRGIRSMVVCDMNRPWGESQNCTNCGKCVQVCPTGALAEKGFAVEEMVKQRSQGDAPGRQARRSLNEEDPACHRVAGRLLRLPHVDARYGRGHSRRGQARRRGLRPAGGRAGVSQGGGRDAGGRRGQLAGRPGEGQHHPPAQQAGGVAGRLRRHRQRSRHAQPASRRASCWSASTSKARRRTAAIPTDGVPALLRQAVPVHEVVKVDLHVPGCPPSAKAIAFVLGELLEGRVPDLGSKVKFG